MGNPTGARSATARFADHRRVRGVLVPFAASYALDGIPVADEKVLAVCADPGTLSAESFTDPAKLPDCP